MRIILPSTQPKIQQNNIKNKSDNDHIECNICFATSLVMKISLCNYYLCLDCLIKLEAPNCPQCRQPIPIPEKFATFYKKESYSDLSTIINQS